CNGWSTMRTGSLGSSRMVMGYLSVKRMPRCWFVVVGAVAVTSEQTSGAMRDGSAGAGVGPFALGQVVRCGLVLDGVPFLDVRQRSDRLEQAALHQHRDAVTVLAVAPLAEAAAGAEVVAVAVVVQADVVHLVGVVLALTLDLEAHAEVGGDGR